MEKTPKSEQGNDASEFTETWLKLEQLSSRQSSGTPEIEELIIEALLKRHEIWLQG